MSKNSSPRIPLVNPPYSTEIQESFDRVMPEGVPPLNIFRTMANNPRVLSRMVKGGLLDRGSVSVADRELIILRSCGLCRAEYEWGVHAAIFADQASINPQQVENTYVANIDASLWSAQQLRLLALVEQLHNHQRVTQSLWQALEQDYSHEQIIELVMLAGLYHAVSFVVNSFQIQNEAFAPTAPE